MKRFRSWASLIEGSTLFAALYLLLAVRPSLFVGLFWVRFAVIALLSVAALAFAAPRMLDRYPQLGQATALLAGVTFKKVAVGLVLSWAAAVVVLTIYAQRKPSALAGAPFARGVFYAP